MPLLPVVRDYCAPRTYRVGYQRWRCRPCAGGLNERMGTLFNRRQYPTDVLCLVIPWRLRYKLSVRDVAEMFLEGGIIFFSRTKRCGSGKPGWRPY